MTQTLWDQIDNMLDGKLPSGKTVRIKLTKEIFVRLVAGEIIRFKIGDTVLEVKKD